MERDDKERQQPSDDGKARPGGGVPVDRLRPWRRISGQLVILIGEALTARLLEQAAASEPQEPEDAQEHK